MGFKRGGGHILGFFIDSRHRPYNTRTIVRVCDCSNVFISLFFYGRLILRPWLTEVRESFTRGGL